MSHRVRYFDTLRFCACVLVYTTHFINKFDSGLFRYWRQFPTSLLLHGMTGKLGVAMFAVILGWFAALAGQKGKNTLSYIIHRYLYFVASGLVINLLYWLAGNLGLIKAEFSLLQVFISSLTIGAEFFSYFWCMRPFFVGSILCFLNTKYHLHPTLVLMEIVLLIGIGRPWIAICLFGEAALLLDSATNTTQWLNNYWLKLVLLVASFILIKRNESVITYLIDGVCSAAVILVIGHSRTLQNVLDWRKFTPITQLYMGVYLIHNLTYRLLGPVLYDAINAFTPPHIIQFFAAYGGCLFMILLLSFPLTGLVNWLSALLSRQVNRLPFLSAIWNI